VVERVLGPLPSRKLGQPVEILSRGCMTMATIEDGNRETSRVDAAVIEVFSRVSGLWRNRSRSEQLAVMEASESCG